MFVFLHLSLFFGVAAAGLWADQLFNGAIAAISQHNVLYATLLLFTLVVSAWPHRMCPMESTHLCSTFRL